LSADLVPEEVPLTAFRELDDVIWGSPMTVREVLEHTRRILDADLSYPIILASTGWIMDGHHRLAKAHLLGHDTIWAVRFKVTPRASF